MFQKPYQGADEELQETLRRGQRITGTEEPKPSLSRTLMVVGWLALLVAVVWILTLPR